MKRLRYAQQFCGTMSHSCFYHTGTQPTPAPQWITPLSLSHVKQNRNEFLGPHWGRACLPQAARAAPQLCTFAAAPHSPPAVLDLSQSLPHLTSGPGSIEMTSEEVHIWWLLPPSLESLLAGGHPPLQACAAMLTAQEVEECSASSDPAARDLRMLARAFLRSVLVQYLPAGICNDPSGLVFHRSRHGKPALVGVRPDPAEPPLRFNLTHTDGLVGVAVALGKEVGLDAEAVRRRTRGDVLRLARRRFAGAEVAQLESELSCVF